MSTIFAGLSSMPDDLFECVRTKNNQKFLKLLVRNVDINVKDQHSRSPLHYAAQAGAIEILRALIFYKACLNAIDNNGDTPLHLAARAGNIRGFFDLMNSGADIRISNKKNVQAIEEFQKDIRDAVAKAIKIFRLQTVKEDPESYTRREFYKYCNEGFLI